MELIHILQLRAETVQGEFATTDMLFSVIQLVTNMDSFATHSSHLIAILMLPLGLNSLSAMRLNLAYVA